MRQARPGHALGKRFPTVQYSTVRLSTVRYSAVQCSTAQWQYSTVQCSAVQCSAVLLRTPQGSAVQDSDGLCILANLTFPGQFSGSDCCRLTMQPEFCPFLLMPSPALLLVFVLCDLLAITVLFFTILLSPRGRIPLCTHLHPLP